MAAGVVVLVVLMLKKEFCVVSCHGFTLGFRVLIVDGNFPRKRRHVRNAAAPLAGNS